jgi:hypothetical protein
MYRYLCNHSGSLATQRVTLPQELPAPVLNSTAFWLVTFLFKDSVLLQSTDCIKKVPVPVNLYGTYFSYMAPLPEDSWKKIYGVIVLKNGIRQFF